MSEWQVLHVEAAPDLADLIEADLWELGCGGIERRDADQLVEKGAALPPAGKSWLWASFEGAAAAAGARDVLAAREGVVILSLQPAPQQDWSSSWRDRFTPHHIRGKNGDPAFLVRAPWHQEPPAPGETVIIINPGMAFGTGEHETTRLCLRAFAERAQDAGVLSAQRWLDLGCGTAILAMAANLRGVPRVVGMDIDPDAIRVAREVLEDNPGARVELIAGELQDAPGEFHGVFANILLGPLKELAPGLAKKITPGGLLIASGVLNHQAGELIGAMADAGFRLLDHLTEGEWSCCVFSAPEG
ncbi:MAG: Ribosomal protein L11 methyltransferase [Myxococcota bacterium]|nr:Ribosomal protein L11 methyltransferase [Myxococcota bacterium]